MSEDTDKDERSPERRGEPRTGRAVTRRSIGSGVATARTYVGRLVWLVCLLAALVLAVGALLITLKANQDNRLVKAVLDLADSADLGLFGRRNGIKEFTGSDAATKNALFNWGIGALAWLVVGRLLDRVIRPRA